MELLSLKQVRQAVQRGPAGARVHVQVDAAAAKVTRDQKPYCELVLADAADRMTQQLAPLYPNLNLDLLLTGILFHDSGKLWENHLPDTGFSMPYDERGELVGHISIGLELVNTLWRKISAQESAKEWSELMPATED